MRIAVAVPPIRDFYFTPHRLTCLGAKTVYNILLENKIDCRIYLFPLMLPGSHQISLPDELAYLKPYIFANERGKTSYFTKYQHLGPDFSACACQIAETKPDICFISVFAYCYADDARLLASAIKEILPRCIIVAGGPGASACPNYFLARRDFDFVLTGEAESNLSAFMREIQKPDPDFGLIPGCYFQQMASSGAPLPEAAFDIKLSYSISEKQGRELLISTCLSRGCSKKCSFCTAKIAHGNTFRKPSLEAVEHLAQSILINEKWRNQRIIVNFEDDNLLLDPDFLFAAMGIFRKRFPDCGFAMENGIDYAMLTPKLVDKLIGLGLRQFNLSLASTDASVLHEHRRALDLDQYEHLAEYIKSSYGVPIITYFICGLAGDTSASAASTLVFLNRQPTHIGISPFYAIPGMDGFPESWFASLSPRLSAGSSAYQWHENSLSTKSIITAFRISRYINLCKSGPKEGIDSEIVKAIITTHALHGIFREKNISRIKRLSNLDDEMQEAFFAL